MNPITQEQIDALLPFLDRFEAAGFSPGEMIVKEGQFPFFDYDESAIEFEKALYDQGWIATDFDWPEWQESAEEYVNSPEKVESADAETIRKLLMTHSRKDRFCEGHMAAMFENGHIVALLRRLKKIRSNERC
jgi:hypothetical protein